MLLWQEKLVKLGKQNLDFVYFKFGFFRKLDFRKYILRKVITVIVGSGSRICTFYHHSIYS